MAKLLPPKGALVLRNKNVKAPSSSAIVKAPSSSAIVKAPSIEDPSKKILLSIYRKVLKIDKVLKNSLFSKKNDSEKKRISKEESEFDKREKELEKKKPKGIKGIKLPSLPKLGIFDWIKNFITQTILGFIFVRLIDYLPTLLKLMPIIFKAGEFIIDVGGKLLDGLVTFIDWGYNAYDATRGFVKNIFGEDGVKQFDQLSGLLNKFLNLALIAGMMGVGSGGKGGKGFGGRGGGRGSVGIGGRASGRTRTVTSAAARRYAERFGRDAAIRKFGKEGVESLGGRYARSAFTNFARKGLVGLAGKGGAKAILGIVRPLLKRLPIIGALIDFGLSVALGEPLGRAAFKAIGAGLLGAVGAAIGSVVPVAGNIIGGIVGGVAGDAIGGALYDLFFEGKRPSSKKGSSPKRWAIDPRGWFGMAGGGKSIAKKKARPVSRTLKKSKKRKAISFTPTKIKPGRSAGGEAKVEKVFPNPEKQQQRAWWDPLGLFTGKNQQNQPQQQQKSKDPGQRVANPQKFLIKSNDIAGRSDFFGPFFTLAYKAALGDTPNKLDYLKVAQGLNSWMLGVFKTGTIGFAGGGEVDAKQFFEGEDYTKVIAKSVEDSVSDNIDTIIRDLRKELSLKGLESEDAGQQSGVGSSTGPDGIPLDGGNWDTSPEGRPGPSVKTTKGFNAGKGDKSRRIFLHWTASDYRSNFNNYHTTFLSDGTAIRNTPNYGIDKTEHTGGGNTNSVGLSIAAMKDGSPTNFGKYPPTSAQVSAMALEAARLAVAWGWDESTIDKNVKTHGEWERYATSSGILSGAPQRWDLDKLRAGDKMNSGGDKLRKMIKIYFRKLKQGTTTDAGGVTKVTSTGAPIAQMSLETATEMMEPGSTRPGARITGGNADFWILAAIASLESGTPQGQADIAQSIYNRVASRANFGQGSNHTIKGHILAPGQYQPVRETKGGYDTWSKIVDKQTAIQALSLHSRGGNAAQMIERAAANIRNSALQRDAAQWVGGRTDFAQPGAANRYPGGIGFRTRGGHLFGWYVGPAAIAYGNKNPGPAAAPALGNIVVMGGTTPGNVNQSGLPPLPPTGTLNGQNYGDWRRGGRKHAGQDYDAPTNGTFYSRLGGVVQYIGNDPGGYYKFVDIYNPQLGVTERIAEGDNILVRMGQSVSRGTPVSRGTSTTGVFHYEIRRGSGTTYGFDGTIDPKKFLSSSAAFHGKSFGIVPPNGLKLTLHRGEMYTVIDKDSVDLFGKDFIQDIIDIENKSQLIAKAPSIIEKLEAISGYKDKVPVPIVKKEPPIVQNIQTISDYTGYEQPYPEREIVEVPVEVPVPMPMGGGGSITISSGGGRIDNNTFDEMLAQV